MFELPFDYARGKNVFHTQYMDTTANIRQQGINFKIKFSIRKTYEIKKKKKLPALIAFYVVS